MDGNKYFTYFIIYFQVARGNCFIDLSDEEDSEISCIIYALKKFTGGLGDDDDKDRGDNFTWKRYFTKVTNRRTFGVHYLYRPFPGLGGFLYLFIHGLI